jgi:hypothetical protein
MRHESDTPGLCVTILGLPCATSGDWLDCRITRALEAGLAVPHLQAYTLGMVRYPDRQLQYGGGCPLRIAYMACSAS